MNIAERMEDGVTVLAIDGRLDANTSGELEQRFLALHGQGADKFVFDLGSLVYVSSAGLRSLLLAAKKTKASAGKLVLARMNEQVKEVFDMSGFSAIFEIRPTVEEAVRAAR